MNKLLVRLLSLAAVVNYVYSAPTFNRDDLNNLSKVREYKKYFEFCSLDLVSDAYGG